MPLRPRTAPDKPWRPHRAWLPAAAFEAWVGWVVAGLGLAVLATLRARRLRARVRAAPGDVRSFRHRRTRACKPSAHRAGRRASTEGGSRRATDFRVAAGDCGRDEAPERGGVAFARGASTPVTAPGAPRVSVPTSAAQGRNSDRANGVTRAHRCAMPQPPASMEVRSPCILCQPGHPCRARHTRGHRLQTTIRVSPRHERSKTERA